MKKGIKILLVEGFKQLEALLVPQYKMRMKANHFRLVPLYWAMVPDNRGINLGKK